MVFYKASTDVCISLGFAAITKHLEMGDSAKKKGLFGHTWFWKCKVEWLHWVVTSCVQCPEAAAVTHGSAFPLASKARILSPLNGCI